MDEALIFGVVLLLILELWALMYVIHQNRDI